MTNRTLNLTKELYQYMLDTSLREPPLWQQLRADTARMPDAHLQISPDQAQFIALLTLLNNTHKALEIGTFTGYSALSVANALPSDGHLVCCDVNEEWTNIAQRYWKEAGLASRITLKLGPALETLNELLHQGEQESFDQIFIDADKPNYLNYYELGMQLLKPGGLIIVDNVLWGGEIVNTQSSDPKTEAIRQFNHKIHSDQRVDLALVPIGDGLTLARKRPSI